MVGPRSFYLSLRDDLMDFPQATPHVAGLVAYLIGKDGNISPAAMETKIKSLSVKNALTGIRTLQTSFE